jgi:hypothetical protein
MGDHQQLDPEIAAHYASVSEQQRLGPWSLERALEASSQQPATPLASAGVGDARQLDWPDASVDAALLLGPLYHLTGRGDRLRP